jgi:hypothetical protein
MAVLVMTGCFAKFPKETLKKIDGVIKCEFRVGQNPRFIGSAVETDAVFDKEKFITLFNEYGKYDPKHLKYHLDECDLKINSEEQPEEWNKIFNSGINIKAVYGEKSSSVDVFQYDSKLYFFVLSMGSRSKPDEIGYYYIELSDEMSEYWRPIIDKVVKEAKENSSTQLTLDAVVELSAKGDELTWDDFKQYKGTITYAGSYVKSFDIDENFELVIAGTSDVGKPKYIKLVSKTSGERIDIRENDVKAFISANS